MATLNTLTLRTDESLTELQNALTNIKWDIIGLSEVRRMGECIEEHEEFILFYKGETPGSHGVGFMIKKYLKEYIEEIVGISERIAILNLVNFPRDREKCTIIQVYSPTEQSKKEILDKFYLELNEAIGKYSHNFLLVMGDFNAQIGQKVSGEDMILGPYCLNKKRTNNGERLINFSFENKLKILNTNYNKKPDRKWTWSSPDGTYKNEIDFILSNKEYYFNDVSVINNLNFNTNHRMVRATIKSKIKKKSRSKYQTSTPYLTEINQSVIVSKLISKVENFYTETKFLSLQDKYNFLEKSIQEALTITTNSNNNVKNSSTYKKLSESTKVLINKRKILLEMKNKTKEARKDISEVSKQIKESIRNDKSQAKMKLIEDIVIKTGGIKKAHKRLTDYEEWIPKMKNKKGEMHTKRPDILKTATEYYKQLYKADTITQEKENTKGTMTHDLPIPDIMESEVLWAISTLKKEKALGPDKISNEILMASKEHLTPILCNLFNEIVQSETIPTQWTESTIILLYKKGDKYDMSNYRPISLMSNIYKTFSKVILNRLTKILDENQPREQAGFRSGYSVLDHIHTVRQLFEKRKEYNLPLYCSFVDYKKAFDSLEHKAIWEALRDQGVEEKYVRIIEEVYKTSTAKIRLDKKGGRIDIKRGVRQGDPVSPKIFAAVLENIFRGLEWQQFGITINGNLISHLRFADDLILFSDSPKKLQTMISDLDIESKKAGLHMNMDKTKVMTLNEKTEIKVNNETIDYVDEYSYLGQNISPDDQMNKEIQNRTTNAWKRYWSLKEIFKDKHMNIKVKTKLFETCISPILTYGCQTWALTKQQLTKLSTCQNSMERSMLNIKRKDKIKISHMRESTKLKDIKEKVGQLKWSWAGHIMRGPDKWSKESTTWFPREGKRNQGRPFTRWADELVKGAGKTWTRRTQDREEWRRLGEAYVNGQTN